jgi:predicted ABC-type ATPase
MIAGPNGSGKSTLTNELMKLGLVFGDYLNADDIAATLSGSMMEIALAAQNEVRVRREAALAERRDHCFETVMSHPSHIDHLRAARAAGFETRLYFVATDDPEINVARVANRVLHGGHDVPVDRIVSRYHRCLSLLPDAIAAADDCLIFDNSRLDEPLRLLAIINGTSRLDWHDVDPAELPNWWKDIVKSMAGYWSERPF